MTPLNISTSDGETLFAWHILPIGLYAKHEEELLAETTWLSDDVTERKGFQLLVDDPESKLIILCKRSITYWLYTDTANHTPQFTE